jgi:hypothetical protein
MSRKLISSEESVTTKCQHTKPCSDCPWSRDALNGWLGGASAEEWIKVAHGDQVVPCHVISNQQCAGLAIYRRNVAKLPMPPNLILEKDKENVFANPTEFKAHHERYPV